MAKTVESVFSALSAAKAASIFLQVWIRETKHTKGESQSPRTGPRLFIGVVYKFYWWIVQSFSTYFSVRPSGDSSYVLNTFIAFIRP